MNDAIVAIFAGNGTPEKVVSAHEGGRKQVTTANQIRDARRPRCRAAGGPPPGPADSSRADPHPPQVVRDHRAHHAGASSST